MVKRALRSFAVTVAVLAFAPVAAVAVPSPAVAAPVVTTDQHGTVAYLPVVPRSSQTDTSSGTTVTTLGVSIGDVFIPSEATSEMPLVGYQVVVVSAAWAPSADGTGSASLTGGPDDDGLISNTTYTVAGEGDLVEMFADIDAADYSACSPNGCYLIVASLFQGLGFASCTGDAVLAGDNGGCDPTTALPGSKFAALGGSYASSFADPSASYSLVTPVARNISTAGSAFAGSGNGYEALSCVVTATAADSACTQRPMGPSTGAVNGSVTGALVASVLDQPAVFTPTGHGSIEARSISTQGSDSYNTVAVTLPDQATTVQSDPVASTDAAFHVVQVDRTSLGILDSGTYVVNSPGQTDRAGLLADLQNPVNGSNENTIWVIASIGTIDADQAGADFVAVAQAMADVGASFTTINRLGIAPPAEVSNGETCPTATLGDYAYIGWAPPAIPGAPLSEAPTIESAGVVQCVSRGAAAPATTTVAAGAVTVQNQRGFYAGQSWSSLQGVAGVQQAVFTDSTALWPITRDGSTTPTPGQAAAYAELSGVASVGVTDIRTSYGTFVRDTELNGITTALQDVSLAQPRSDAAYTNAEFTAVQEELVYELTAIEAVAQYNATLTTIFGQALVDVGDENSGAYAAVASALSSPDPNRTVVADLVGGVGSILDDLAQFVPGGSLFGSAIGAVSEMTSLGLQFQGTSGSYQTSLAALQSTWGGLVNQIPQVYTQQTNALNVTVSLAAVDPDRLQALAAAVGDFNTGIGQNAFTPTDIADGYGRNATKTFYTAYLNQAFLVYSKVALNSAVDFTEASPTDAAYPFTGKEDGLSLHTIVCFEEGTCAAEGAQTNNYFVYLAGANTAATVSNGDPTMFWGVYFLAGGDGGCASECRVTFPRDTIFDNLFDVPVEGDDLPLGIYPEDFYDRFGGLSAASYDQWCEVSLSSDEGACDSSGGGGCIGICEGPGPSDPGIPSGPDSFGKGAGALDRAGTGSLPNTGGDFAWWLLPAGGALTAAGVLLVVALRRRRVGSAN